MDYGSQMQENLKKLFMVGAGTQDGETNEWKGGGM